MSESYRTARDSLGEVQVPVDALYDAQTQRAIDNFPISDLRFPRRFIEAVGLIKQACAEVNRDLEYLEPRIADAIMQAAQSVADGEFDDQFAVDIFQTGSGTSTNMNANEVIANRATEILGGKRGDKTVHPNDHVNMSQSSNDTIPTAMHIAARQGIENDLIPALRKLEKALQKKAEDFDDVLKSGRTHLMDATPIRLGQEFGGYAAQVSDNIDRLQRASEELSEVTLGGTAVGTGLNRPEEFPERVLSLISERTDSTYTETDNHFAAQGGKDTYVSVAGTLNTLASSLLKIANDIRWLASGPTSGIHEISIPAIQPGSSIMPGKINPVQNEALIMVCARVMGNTTTLTVGGQHGNFELNVMMPVMAHAMLESIEILSNSVASFTSKCVKGIEANRERCQELLELNPSIATALNTTLGYDKASKVAKKAASEGIPVRQAVLELDLLDEDELDEVLDIRRMTEPGVPGNEDE